MQTIQIDLKDELYMSLKKQGVDIQNEIQDYLQFLTNDNYPKINTTEAKKRVKNAYDEYHKNGVKSLNTVDDLYWNTLEK